MKRTHRVREDSRLLGVVAAVVVIATMFLARVVFIPLALALLFSLLLTPVITSSNESNSPVCRYNIGDVVAGNGRKSEFGMHFRSSAVRMAHARALYSKLRARAPGLHIVICLWHFEGDAQRVTRRLKLATGDGFFTTITQVLHHVAARTELAGTGANNL
jgi:hypothetical protein